LLDLAKIDSGKVELAREAVSCAELLEEIGLTLAPLCEAKALELEIGVNPADLVVETDRRALTQILLNLGSNAVKFTDHGFVRIDATPGRDRARARCASRWKTAARAWEKRTRQALPGVRATRRLGPQAP
jgi:signal transduction histidine kinase